MWLVVPVIWLFVNTEKAIKFKLVWRDHSAATTIMYYLCVIDQRTNIILIFFTLITWIPLTIMNWLGMFDQIWCACCLLITPITWIINSFMNPLARLGWQRRRDILAGWQWVPSDIGANLFDCKTRKVCRCKNVFKIIINWHLRIRISDSIDTHLAFYLDTGLWRI